MATPSLSYDDLKALNPCTDSLRRVAKLMGGAKKWDGKKISAAYARKAGATFDDIVWAASALSRTDKDTERRLRLWMVDCAARVLHIFEKELPADLRPRNAIVAARQFARNEISDATWAARAARDASDAARAAAWAAASDAARAAAWAAWAAASDAARAAASDAARAAARAAASDAARAARDAEHYWQFDRLIEWLSDKEPEDYLLPGRPTKVEAA